MAQTFNSAFFEDVLDIIFNGQSTYSASAFYLILTNGGTFSNTSTIADIVAKEVVGNGYARANYNPSASAWDGGQSRAELSAVTCSYTASGGAIQFSEAALIADASSNAPKQASSFDGGTNRITVTSHGLTNSDKVMITVDAGGVMHTGISGTTIYYAKSIDSNTIEIYTDSGLTSIVDFTADGSGTFRLRYANGQWISFDDYGSTSTIPDGATTSIYWATNGGTASADVEAA